MLRILFQLWPIWRFSLSLSLSLPPPRHSYSSLNEFYFQKIEQPFLEAVKRTLEDRYSENVESTYKVTIKFIIETLIDGFDKAQNDKAQSGTAKS